MGGSKGYGQHGSKGGRNDNLTVQQFCDAAVSFLRLQRSEMIKNLHIKVGTLEIDETPLPKQKC